MNNPLLYNALLNGFSGGAVTNLWVPDLAASSFANTKAQAIAFATEVDSLIPTITNGATASQGQLLSAISQAIMNRPAVTGTLTYSDIAESIASMFNEITAALVSTENEIVVPVVLTPSGAGGFTNVLVYNASALDAKHKLEIGYDFTATDATIPTAPVVTEFRSNRTYYYTGGVITQLEASDAFTSTNIQVVISGTNIEIQGAFNAAGGHTLNYVGSLYTRLVTISP